MKNKLLASKFIEWYYSDHEDVKILGTSMMHLLLRTGQCSISFQEVFDECGYIPKYICEDNDGIDEYSIDYNPEDVELINDFK
jgi:hypothetical protein